MAFQNKLSTKKLIPPHVRGAGKFRKNLEMGFLYPDGPVGCVAIFKHKEISKKRLTSSIEGAFSESCPEVESASHGLFGSVVEIVSKRRAHLRFCFQGRYQPTLFNHEQIPFLGGPEKAGKLQVLFMKNVFLCYAGFNYQLGKKLNEAVHLSAAGYGASQTGIVNASILLLFPLCVAGHPVAGYCF